MACINKYGVNVCNMRIAAGVLMLCSKYCLSVVLLYRLCAVHGLGMLVVCNVFVILCVCKYVHSWHMCGVCGLMLCVYKYMFVGLLLICVLFDVAVL